MIGYPSGQDGAFLPARDQEPLSEYVYQENYHERALHNDFMYAMSSGGGGGAGGDTPYNGLYGEAPPERGTFFKLQAYKRVGKSVI